MNRTIIGYYINMQNHSSLYQIDYEDMDDDMYINPDEDPSVNTACTLRVSYFLQSGDTHEGFSLWRGIAKVVVI